MKSLDDAHALRVPDGEWRLEIGCSFPAPVVMAHRSSSSNKATPSVRDQAVEFKVQRKVWVEPGRLYRAERFSHTDEPLLLAHGHISELGSLSGRQLHQERIHDRHKVSSVDPFLLSAYAARSLALLSMRLRLDLAVASSFSFLDRPRRRFEPVPASCCVDGAFSADASLALPVL